jgi:hypothetical protein
MSFEMARKIADAVLYEGYLLYPYRPLALKNRFRWQFGVIAPPAWSEAGGEPWEMQTECLVEPQSEPVVEIVVRFLQVRDDGGTEQSIERTVEMRAVRLDERGRDLGFEIDGGTISGVVRTTVETAGPYWKLRVRIENRTPLPEAATSERTAAMRHSMIGTHTMLTICGGAFLSMTDPPPEGAAGCCNLNTWPVLIGAEGARDVMLSSPIILPDYPAIAPESQGDFFDSTEIDELLTLRVMTLTDEEKREALAGGDRARRVIERCDNIPPEIFERLHGAIRSIEPSEHESFFNPASERPEVQAVEIGSRNVSRGERVRLLPRRNADSMDMFLAGRIARVAAVHRDVEDRVYVAVTVEDDPAADMHEAFGRFLYFYPDELELLEKEA